MKPVNGRFKSILIDIGGVSLIILGGITGPLPGPGGIPLIIAGLSLLSINHEWAERWLKFIKSNGVNLSDKLFNGSRTQQIAIDLFGIIILSGSVLILFMFTQNIAKTAAIWLLIIAFVLLIGNKKRYSKLRIKR